MPCGPLRRHCRFDPFASGVPAERGVHRCRARRGQSLWLDPAGRTCPRCFRPLPHPLAPDLERLAAEIAATVELAVHGVQVLTHRIPMTVLVQVQRLDGEDISLDECAAYSSRFSEALDGAELLQEAFVLEVSSPGISEELQNDRDFRSFRGFPVEILCHSDRVGEQRRTGLLLERNDTHVLLNVQGRTVRLPRDSVLSVRLTSPGP